MKHQAIYNLYPNAIRIKETDNGTFVAQDINDNNISIDMSAVNKKATELQTAEETEAQAKIDLKASAKAKLIAGEPLTEDEANTIVLT